jgi:hypothetical protein
MPASCRPAPTVTTSFIWRDAILDRSGGSRWTAKGRNETSHVVPASAICGKASDAVRMKAVRAQIICEELTGTISSLAPLKILMVVILAQQIERALDFAEQVLILECRWLAWRLPPNLDPVDACYALKST